MHKFTAKSHFRIKEDENGEIVLKKLRNKKLTEVSIPDYITVIDRAAFENCTNLTNVIIPNSVKIIDTAAFEYCTNLTNVTIPNSVKIIGITAFKYCTNLTEITIPSSVDEIGEVAFLGCERLASINVSPDNQSFSSVDGVVFNKELTKLICYPEGKAGSHYIIPNSVNEIGEGAFTGSNLTEVTIPDSVTKIGESAFDDCYAPIIRGLVILCHENSFAHKFAIEYEAEYRII